MEVEAPATDVQAKDNDVETGRAQGMLQMRRRINKVMTPADLGGKIGVRSTLNELEFAGILPEDVRPAEAADEGILPAVAPKVLGVHRVAQVVEHVVGPNVRHSVDGPVEDGAGPVPLMTLVDGQLVHHVVRAGDVPLGGGLQTSDGAPPRGIVLRSHAQSREDVVRRWPLRRLGGLDLGHGQDPAGHGRIERLPQRPSGLIIGRVLLVVVLRDRHPWHRRRQFVDGVVRALGLLQVDLGQTLGQERIDVDDVAEERRVVQRHQH